MRASITKTTTIILYLHGIIVLGLFGCGRHLAYAFPTGAPESACEPMIPVHGYPPQTAPSPYTISLSSQDVLPSEIVTVTINGDDLRGFMVSALSDGYAVGTMVSTDGNSKLICQDLSITHTAGGLKKGVSFDWKAPDQVFGDTLVQFRTTVVKSASVFWVDLYPNTSFVILDPPPGVPIPVVPSTLPADNSTQAPDDTPGTVDSTTASPGDITETTSEDMPVDSHNGADTNKFPGHLQADDQCGTDKACFHDCNADGDCTFIISWHSVDDETLAFHMTYRLPNQLQHWIAVGFSKDQEMGDDSVMECIMDDGKVKVQQSYNEGTDNKYLDDKTAALSNETGAVVNGVLICSFHRKTSHSVDPLVFDLNRDYFLLVAFGEGFKGQKMPHTFDALPPVSDHRIDLQKVENVAGEEPPVSVLVQVHGALMILSWVLLTSVGVMTAKYGKKMFPKVNPCGVNIWFQVHKCCMMLVGVMTVIGVVVMFVHCEGYCQIPQVTGKSHWPLHPPLGILVLLLAISNPIMAFFRPAPKAPNRHVFAWSHWGVGVLAWIMACFAIFIGLSLERAHAPPEATYVMVVWGIYHVIILVVMETLPRPLSNFYNAVAEMTVQRGRMYNLERAQQDNMGYMAEDGNTEQTVSQPDDVHFPKTEKPANKEMTREELKVQKMILLVHYGIVIILTFTLLLVVYLYTPPLP